MVCVVEQFVPHAKSNQGMQVDGAAEDRLQVLLRQVYDERIARFVR